MNKLNVVILLAQLFFLVASIFLFVTIHSADLVSTDGQSKDAIAIAAQIGRLDVISLIFAMFGIILAIFAFVGFFSIRAHAEQIAIREATEVAERIANQRVDFLMSSTNIKPVERAKASDIDTDDAERLTGEEQ